MNTIIPFWIINPINNNVSLFEVDDWLFCSREMVCTGNSPLESYGEKIYFDLHNRIGLYDNCVFIFYSKQVSQNDCYKLDKILKPIASVISSSVASSYGAINFLNNSNRVISPPPLKNVDNSIKLIEFDLNNAKRIVSVVKHINQTENNIQLELFSYLNQIKKSPEFISELALWSFIEHHWSSNKESSKLDQSLKRLFDVAFESNAREERKKFLKEINSIGERLGLSYNEKKLRNILAHGKHLTLKENWSEHEWFLFFKVHEKLFNFVLLSIEKETLNIL